MSAWAAIEELAAGLVAKSAGELTHEVAVARVLKTAEGAGLYAAYQEEQAQAIVAAGLDPHAGYVPDAARVRKATDASAAIDELARKLRAQHPDWTLDQCVDKVLRTPEGRDLYAAAENARRGGSVGPASAAIESPGDARGDVRKSGGRVHLSKAAEDFLRDFAAWLDQPRKAVAKTAKRPVTLVRSADVIRGEIETLAAEVVVKSGGAVSHDDALDRVMETAAGRQLETDYVRALRSEGRIA